MTKKKPSLSRLQNKVWELVKQIVYIRDQSTCQKCGKYVEGNNRHPSHVIPKSHGNVLRFDPLNVKTMCFHCHMNWWHKNPMESAEWFAKKFPERWEYLQKRKEEIVKFKAEDYEQMIKDYQQLIAGLEISR